MSRLLLDTHVFIWFVNGNKELSSSVVKSIVTKLHENEVCLATISLWEIAMLNQRGRIVLEMPCLEWFNKAIEMTRIKLTDLSPGIAYESCNLPGDFHDDPADRMIVATARVENLAVVTRDKRMHAYAKSHFVSVIKA